MVGSESRGRPFLEEGTAGAGDLEARDSMVCVQGTHKQFCIPEAESGRQGVAGITKLKT